MRKKTMIGAVLALLLAGLAVLALAAGRAGGGENEETTRQATSTERSVAAGEAGMRVALDPETGALVQVAGEREERRERDRTGALSTYGRDLVQEPLPQGGFKVDLQGRFQSAVVASIDPVTDEVTIDCAGEHEGAEAEDDHAH